MCGRYWRAMFRVLTLDHRPAFFRRKSPLQRSEHVFTLSQSRAHFLRHAKGRAHASQIFSGKLDLV